MIVALIEGPWYSGASSREGVPKKRKEGGRSYPGRPARLNEIKKAGLICVDRPVFFVGFWEAKRGSVVLIVILGRILRKLSAIDHNWFTVQTRPPRHDLGGLVLFLFPYFPVWLKVP